MAKVNFVVKNNRWAGMTPAQRSKEVKRCLRLGKQRKALKLARLAYLERHAANVKAAQERNALTNAVPAKPEGGAVPVDTLAFNQAAWERDNRIRTKAKVEALAGVVHRILAQIESEVQ